MASEALLTMGCWLTLGALYLVVYPTSNLIYDLIHKREELKSEMITIRIFYIILSAIVLCFITKAIILNT